jgi:puromycin-sensitive aminopeptidase
MSTYLTAVTIGKLEPSATTHVGKIPCRIFAGVGKTAQTGFAMEVTGKVLPWYADYFGKPYNYGKLDQVAVPGFDAGAMENVGAIFYRQNLLLMQEGQTSWGAQKRIAEVIAHEIAHQWFGNLVTMQWWDDLWLNEAFATWMAYTVCHDLYPDWHIWDDYLEGKEGALIADALTSTHPIYSPVHNPAEATELFDVITYEKGCAVLRMCEHYLGHKVFRSGIRAYMKAFANKNAQGDDLWKALSLAAKKPVQALMHDWIHRPGHPLVRCSQKADDKTIVLTLSQKRFLAHKPAGKGVPKGADAKPWMIPMVIVYDAGDGVKQHRFLFDKSKADVTLPSRKGQKLLWAYINHDATGFYRSHMAPRLQNKLLQHGLGHLSAGAKMALVNDQWALTRSGDGSIAALMPLLLRLSKDEDPGVFRAVASRLRALYSHVVEEGQQEPFRALVREICRPHIERLGYTAQAGESMRTATLRAAVIDLMGFVGKDAQVLKEADHQATLEQQDPGAVDANIAGSWIALHASTGDSKRLAQLVGVYQERKSQGLSPEMCSRYLYALCAFEKPKAIAEVLGMTLDGTVPQEQLRVILSSLLMRKASGKATWTFLKKHWADIGPKVGGMGIARLVESTGALPYSHKKDVASFFAKHPVAEAERAVKKAMEAFDLWAALRQQHEAPLGQWLKAHGR